MVTVACPKLMRTRRSMINGSTVHTRGLWRVAVKVFNRLLL